MFAYCGRLLRAFCALTFGPGCALTVAPLATAPMSQTGSEAQRL
jgi:hypothetical protein